MRMRCRPAREAEADSGRLLEAEPGSPRRRARGSPAAAGALHRPRCDRAGNDVTRVASFPPADGEACGACQRGQRLDPHMQVMRNETRWPHPIWAQSYRCAILQPCQLATRVLSLHWPANRSCNRCFPCWMLGLPRAEHRRPVPAGSGHALGDLQGVSGMPA